MRPTTGIPPGWHGTPRRVLYNSRNIRLMKNTVRNDNRNTMKARMTKIPSPPESPLPQKTIRLRPNGKAVTPPKSKTRDNIFSRSRDTREDRGSRQMKTSHNSQTFSHR